MGGNGCSSGRGVAGSRGRGRGRVPNEARHGSVRSGRECVSTRFDTPYGPNDSISSRLTTHRFAESSRRVSRETGIRFGDDSGLDRPPVFSSFFARWEACSKISALVSFFFLLLVPVGTAGRCQTWANFCSENKKHEATFRSLSLRATYPGIDLFRGTRFSIFTDRRILRE